MKKFFSIVLLLALLISLCACGKEEPQPTAAVDTTAATLDPSSPEAMYGHIDQTQPVDGVYKIWNADGVKNIANHPEGSFELLCSVDMGGAELAPIGTFTGTLNGANWTISNFTLKGGSESFGFVSVNKGKLHNLYLTEVTFAPAGAKNMGALVGINEGEILRCTVSGTMAVETAAADAYCGGVVSVNTGAVANIEATVDVRYNAQGNACVGGLIGKAEGGNTEYVDQFGKLTVTGGNKTTGLIAGAAKDATFTSCVFSGADNSLDGKLLNNYFGTEENVTYEKLLWRDNSREPEDPTIQALREKTVQAVYEICTIEWHPEQDIPHTCNCSMLVCNGVYSNTYTQIGLPYNHKGGSLARMKYCLNEDGTVKDWVYDMAAEGTIDTFDMYMGNDCSTAVQQAWWTVSNKVEFLRSGYQSPVVADFYNGGVVPVGDYEADIEVLGLDPTTSGRITGNVTKYNGPEVMYESYAMLRMGDGVCYLEENGHSRMCAEDAVVVRDENGKIDPQYSYVLMHEQGVQRINEEQMTYSMCDTFVKYTFDVLYNGTYLPCTVPEFKGATIDVPTCTLEGGLEADNRYALTTGVVKANYSLDYVTMVITDENGKVIFDHWLFPSVAKRLDNNSNDYEIRRLFTELDLAAYAIPLREIGFAHGKTYHATITGYLATGDSFVVKDFTFQNG